MAFIDPVTRDIDALKDEDKARRIIENNFQIARSYQEPLRRTWDENYDLYRGRLRIPANYPLHSRVTVPVGHAFVETMTPFYVDALYDDRQFIIGLAHRKKDIDTAQRIGKITNYQYTVQVRYINKLIDTIKMAHIYGMSWQMPFSRFEKALDFKPMTDEEKQSLKDGTLEGVEVEGDHIRRVTYSGFDVKVKDPYDVFPDYEFQEVPDMRFVITREYTTLGKLAEIEFDRNGGRVLSQLDKLADTTVPEDSSMDRERRLSAQGKSGRTSDRDQQLNRNMEDKTVELLHYWMDPWLVTLGNRKVVIFSDANPTPSKVKPIVPWRQMRDPGFLWGISMLEVIRPLIHTMNTMMNQRLDNVSMKLNPMWKVKRSGAIATRQLASRPGGYVHVNNMDDIQPLEIPDVTGTALTQMRDVLSWAEMATGVQEFFRGEQPATGRFPASGIALLLRATTGRFKMTTQGFYDSMLQVLKMTHEINKEFIDDVVVARFQGRKSLEFEEATRDEFRNTSLDLIPIGKASSGNPDFLLQKLIELWGMWQQETDIDRTAFKQTILELAGLRNTTEIIPPKLEDEPEEGEEIPETEVGGGEGGPADALAEILGQIGEGGGAGEAGIPEGAITPSPTPQSGQPITPLALQPTVTDKGGTRMIRVPGT